MSLSQLIACIKATTFSLAMLITQTTLATNGNPPEWIRICDSLNRILAAPVINHNSTYRWQEDYTTWLQLEQKEAVGKFMANYFLEANPVYFSRDVNISLYQATASITLEPEFETPVGDEMVAEIVGFENDPPVNAGTTNNDMNWIVTREFDENGNVVNEKKIFFNKSGHEIQSQVKSAHRQPGSTATTQVFATQPIQDAYGRDVATTLPAPINNSEFSYHPSFVRGVDGNAYTYRNFDRFDTGSGPESDKTNNPDPIGSQHIPGTLGWYYSSNNNWEPYTPTTNYPYIRQTYYRDGTGAMKKAGGPGEVFKIGSGHEQSNYNIGVINELNHYIQVRNRFFSQAEIGNTPALLTNEAVLGVAEDVNGKELVQVFDKSSKLLFTARPGNDLTVTNAITLKPLSHVYTFPALPSGSGCPNPGQEVKFSGSGSIIKIVHPNPGATPIIFNGPVDGASVYFNGADWQSVVKSDAPFTVTYVDRQGNTCQTVSVTANSSNTITNDNAPFHYFKILADNSDVTITGDYTLVDMNTEAVTALLPGNKLNRGYYKLYPNNIDASVTVTYTNKLTDISYRFYNQLGELVATIAPEGVKKLLGNGLNNYASKTDIPFINTYEYDVQGRVIKFSSPDGGITEMVYRTDGKIRFSQNNEQKLTGRYSYTNFDQSGRLIEGGEYQPDAGGIQFNSDMSAAINPMRDILENTATTGGLTTGIKKDVIMTLFDIADNSHNQSSYVQDAAMLRGSISRTKKYSIIINNTPNDNNMVSSRWYNYDESGNVLWEIRYTNGFGITTTENTFDVQGRVVKSKYHRNGNDMFIHYFEYDPATQKLWKVYTNTVDNAATRTLHATYIYYLHGPIKRIELANNLQGIDYSYTLHGALKSINNSNKTKDPGNDGNNSFMADAFGMVLDYFPGDYQNNRTTGIQPITGINTTGIGTNTYNGDIKAMTWYSKKPLSIVGSNPGIEDATSYVYQYDDKYQFVESTWGTGINFGNTPATFTATGINKETIRNSTNGSAYDANGNIMNLRRTNGAGTLVDNFAYNYYNSATNTGSAANYNTNKLESVVQNSTGLPYASYTYDKTGKLVGEVNTNDGGDKSKFIEYDVTGKVVAVYRDNTKQQKVVEYVYDELGARILKKSYNNAYALNLITYYIGTTIYTQPVTGGTLGALTVQEYIIDGGGGRLGTYYPQIPVYAYELNDHQGNVRAVVAKSANSLEVRTYTDYYPYGKTIPGPLDYRHGYQGQHAEKDGETDWNAFELRMYDSRIGRWLQFDAQDEYWSPYVGMGNDPVNKTDPSGGCTDCPDSRTWNDRSKYWIDPNGSRWEAGDNGWSQVMDQVSVVGRTKSPSWGVGNFSLFTFVPSMLNRLNLLGPMEVDNLFEQTWASVTSRRQAILTGPFIEAIRNDPEMGIRNAELLDIANSLIKFYDGADAHATDKKVVGFGGYIGGSRKWDQWDKDHPILHRETWAVAGNKLTWSIRNATVESVVSVHDGGKVVHIEHYLRDVWDLSPQKGRSKLYDAVSIVGGIPYHYGLGGNHNMLVTASWTDTFRFQ